MSALPEQARAALRNGRLEQAETLALRWRAEAPEAATAHRLLGQIALAQRRPAAALPCLRRATELASAEAGAWAELARCLSLLRQLPESLAAAAQALALPPLDATCLDTLGVVHSRAHRHAEAAELFRQAATAAPGDAGIQFNLASALKFLGDFDAAETAYEACLTADPHCWKAYPALSQLRRQTPERNHLARYQALLPVARSVDAQLQLRLAMAKEYEDLGEPREAFRQLQAGKAPKRASLGYDSRQDAALFAALRGHFAAAGPTLAGHDSEAPIFVFGLPRTGTTLVERILSSHSQVWSAGELQDFGLVLKRASGSRSPRLLDDQTLSGLRGVDPGQVGAAYVARAATGIGTGGRPRFVDKMPLNFLYAGFIAQALPGARMICLRRHPLDSCLSNYRQLFALEFSYYNYAYDLLDTGRYYIEFERLMAFWQQRFPGRILELRYEQLVADPEAAIRRLLQHCGLPWEDACLHFEQNAAPVSTASAVQVRQPIYRSSVHRWKGLQAELEPLRQLLLAGGVTLDE